MINTALPYVGECQPPGDDMEHDDKRPYYGDEEQLSLLWFLREPLLWLVALMFVLASVMLWYWAFY